ncbi:MAG: hypothetical protein JWO94_3700 [Verrucomicrobiaceae bacterium]|nr:hypothetical protein [Verrucomicrobiaceae bacterium]
MRRVRLRGEATQDMAEAALFHEKQRIGLGPWFASTLYDEIEILGLIGGVHRIRQGFHCYLSRRFPYGVYYRIEGDMVGVYAIVDQRQNPRTISRLLRDLNAQHELQ